MTIPDRPSVPVTVVLDEPIAMRDGTVLRADVYRPATGGPHRTVLVRNPYAEQVFRNMPVTPWLRAGMAVVLQFCRGRGTSDGTFTPWRDEGRDGADTVAWIVDQPWSNGEVVASGGSYLAGCALQLAAERPEGLKAVAAAMTPHDFYDGLKYHGGAFAFGSAFFWASLQVLLETGVAVENGRPMPPRFLDVLAARDDVDTALATVPVRDAAGLAEAFPFWAEWIDHPERDDYWEELAQALRHDRVDVPVLHTAGWFDLFLKGTLENHRRIPGGRLVIGPWSHMGSDGALGELDFGMGASAQAVQLEKAQTDFLAGNTEQGSAVRYFTMGANTWRETDAWPPPEAVPTRHFLHADGTLSTTEPAADAVPSHFTHDPDNPVPTLGGNLLLPDTRNVGPRDQRALEERPDVLSFTGPVLTEDVEVTGHVTAVLHAETSAPGSDWTVKLVDVWPDGRAMNVTDGIVRSPADRRRHEIDLVATSQTFRTGHRIRVDIASSNFPRFDRHPAMKRSDQTVHHDAEQPSWISLPLMPGK